MNDHSLVSLSLSSRLRPFVRWVRLHRDVLVISFAIGYNANDAERIQRTALGGMEWFCGESGDAGETVEGLERTSSRDSRTADQKSTSINSHTFTLSFSHSPTHEDDDNGRRMSPSYAFFLFKRDRDGTHARTTNDPRFSRFFPSSSTLSLSLPPYVVE